MSEAWVRIGRLLRTRGIKGELIAQLDSSKPGRAEQLKEVRLDVNGRILQARVEQVWSHDGRPVFKFAGIDSISEAQAWAGAEMEVPESEVAGPEEGEYSHADLVGCRVVARKAGAPEEPVGIVKGIEEYGGPPLLRIQAEDGHEILVPFARSICTEIDVAAKIIRAELPEGLAELP